mmetsp:Transcript_7493/g.33861  ORF Transcript_7493/g.33861 Transcript_7493/m.33861 type:complete len:246 (+) Transcript_7493:1616-2353(+)
MRCSSFPAAVHSRLAFFNRSSTIGDSSPKRCAPIPSNRSSSETDTPELGSDPWAKRAGTASRAHRRRSDGIFFQHRSGSPALAHIDSTSRGPSLRSTLNTIRGSNPLPLGSLGTGFNTKPHVTCTPGASSKPTWYPGSSGYSPLPSAPMYTSGVATAAATNEGFEPTTFASSFCERTTGPSRATPVPVYAPRRTNARPTPLGSRSRTGATSPPTRASSSNRARTRVASGKFPELNPNTSSPFTGR